MLPAAAFKTCHSKSKIQGKSSSKTESCCVACGLLYAGITKTDFIGMGLRTLAGAPVLL